MWRYTKRAFSVVILLVVLGVGVSAGFAQRNGGKLLSVQTGSMAPYISKGSLVKVNRVPDNQLAVGDVITYISPKNTQITITHRLVALPSPATKGKIITKGDANPIADVPFSPKYVVGKVNGSVPYMGHVVDFVRKPIGLALLIYVPAFAIMINEVRILSEHYKKMKPYLSSKVIQRLAAGKKSRMRLAPVAMATPLALIISLVVVAPVQATLKSNSVALADSSFTVSVPTPSPNNCVEGSNTNHTTVNIGGNGGGHNVVVVSNSSSQTASSGNATVSGNTTGGNATSGNASNTNCTNININIHN